MCRYFSGHLNKQYFHYDIMQCILHIFFVCLIIVMHRTLTNYFIHPSIQHSFNHLFFRPLIHPHIYPSLLISHIHYLSIHPPFFHPSIYPTIHPSKTRPDAQTHYALTHKGASKVDISMSKVDISMSNIDISMSNVDISMILF